MARSGKARAFTLRQAVDFKFESVPFEPFEAVRTLDLDRLARARRAVVELGVFNVEGCRRIARAVINNGYVTQIKVDGCPDNAVKVTPEFARLVARAQTKLKRATGPALKLPMPVTRFFRRSAQGPVIVISVDAPALCVIVSVDVGGIKVTVICCGSTADNLVCFTR